MTVALILVSSRKNGVFFNGDCGIRGYFYILLRLESVDWKKGGGIIEVALLVFADVNGKSQWALFSRI